MLDNRQRNAIKKAVDLGAGRRVRRVRYGLYRVPSATRADQVYTVSVDAAGTYSCDCPAGLAGNPCWHTAAVYVAKVEHAGRVRVTRPAGH